MRVDVERDEVLVDKDDLDTISKLIEKRLESGWKIVTSVVRRAKGERNKRFPLTSRDDSPRLMRLTMCPPFLVRFHRSKVQILVIWWSREAE